MADLFQRSSCELRALLYDATYRFCMTPHNLEKPDDYIVTGIIAAMRQASESLQQHEMTALIETYEHFRMPPAFARFIRPVEERLQAEAAQIPKPPRYDSPPPPWWPVPKTPRIDRLLLRLRLVGEESPKTAPPKPCAIRTVDSRLAGVQRVSSEYLPRHLIAIDYVASRLEEKLPPTAHQAIEDARAAISELPVGHKNTLGPFLALLQADIADRNFKLDSKEASTLKLPTQISYHVLLRQNRFNQDFIREGALYDIRGFGVLKVKTALDQFIAVLVDHWQERGQSEGQNCAARQR